MTTIKVINISNTSHSYLCVCVCVRAYAYVCVVRTFKIYSLSQFQVYDIVFSHIAVV